MRFSSEGTFRRCVVLLLMALHAGLLCWSAVRHTAAMDELGHLLGGMWVWRTGGFDVYRVNPPLVRTVAAAPVALVGPAYDFSGYQRGPHVRAEWLMSPQFQRAWGAAWLHWALVLARWACIPLSALGAWVCYRFGSELYGTGAGLLALALWSFCPNILGHGQLITPDVGAAAVGVTAGWLFWRFLRSQDGWNALLAGVALGLAQLTKFTWIVLFLLWPMLWLMYRQRPSSETAGTPRRRGLVQLALVLGLGLYIINVGYGFEGSFRRLGDYDFVSHVLGAVDAPGANPQGVGNRFRGTWLGNVPLPLPANYVCGMDLQRRDFERGKWSYLRGEWRFGGWWYYYLYAVAVKVPLGTWALVVLASIAPRAGQRVRGAGRDEVVLLAPAVAVLVLVSSQTGFNHHLRYVLPMFPFLFVYAGRAAAWWGSRRPFMARAVTAALAASVASSLFIYPHSMSYFNEVAGGPRHGAQHLVDSNIDWGQDLFYLQRWLDAHPQARPIRLAYFGSYNPQLVGFDLVPPPPGPADGTAACPSVPENIGPLPGWYALSINRLYDRQRIYEYFHYFKPVASAGYSILIYHITPEEANRVRGQLGLPLLPPGGEQQN